MVLNQYNDTEGALIEPSRFITGLSMSDEKTNLNTLIPTANEIIDYIEVNSVLKSEVETGDMHDITEILPIDQLAYESTVISVASFIKTLLHSHWRTIDSTGKDVIVKAPTPAN